ncbi:MAG: hypothetical protein ACLTZT_14980 [Butyricimonas faecalis]
MGFFNKIFGGGGNEGKKETSADRMLRIIKEKTMTECVKLIPEKGATKPWESKIGGLPYMPKGFDYPYEEAGSTVVTEGQAPWRPQRWQPGLLPDWTEYCSNAFRGFG